MTKVTLQINRMEMAMVTLETEQKLQWLHIEQTQEMSHPWASFLPLPLLLTPLTGERICKIGSHHENSYHDQPTRSV